MSVTRLALYGHLGMYVTRLALYGTLCYVCHSSGLIRDTCYTYVLTLLALYGRLGNACLSSGLTKDSWKCPSLVWPYTEHLEMSVTRLPIHGILVCHTSVLTLLALCGTLGNVRHSSSLTRDTVLMFSQVNTIWLDVVYNYERDT